MRDWRLGGSQPIEVSVPLALLSFRYKWVTPNSVPATHALFLDQMVPVVFKTICLFLALFALPQVLASPSGSSQDYPLSSKDRQEALDAHNKWRWPHSTPGLTWDDHLEVFAALQGTTCMDKKDKAIPGMSSNGLSIFTEDAHG